MVAGEPELGTGGVLLAEEGVGGTQRCEAAQCGAMRRQCPLLEADVPDGAGVGAGLEGEERTPAGEVGGWCC